MEKLDLSKKHKRYYSAKTTPEYIEIEAAQYISIKGQGDPSGARFAEDVQALYATAYTIKFMCKEKDLDFVVAKLEGLWDFDEQKYRGISMTDAPRKIPREEWIYQLLIRMPEFVDNVMVARAREQVVARKQIYKAQKIELFRKPAEKAIQVLHVGPFENEPQTLLLLKEYIDKNNLTKNGLHHEIYLSDFRKTPPEKLKTILREPINS